MDRPKLSISFLRKGEARGSGTFADISKEATARHIDEAALPFDEGETRNIADNNEGFSETSPSPRAEKTFPKEVKKDGEELEEEEAWLQVGLVVKVQETTLAGGLYNGMTGIVKAIVSPGGYGADVQVANGDVIRLDQDDLRTMLPAPGEFGLIVRGNYCDTKVKVISLGKEEVEVELEEGRRVGHRLLLPVDHISRHIAIK